MDVFVEKALALFENGTPTMKQFKELVWLPSHKETGGAHSDQLKAIYHYVDAYHALKTGRITSAYDLLFGAMNVKENLPDRIDTEVMISMYDAVIENKKEQRQKLINERAPVLADGVEKFKAALQNITDELAKQGLEIYIDGGLNTISIEDGQTGISTDIDISIK